VEPAPWIGDDLGKMWIVITLAAFISVRSCWTLGFSALAFFVFSYVLYFFCHSQSVRRASQRVSQRAGCLMEGWVVAMVSGELVWGCGDRKAMRGVGPLCGLDALVAVDVGASREGKFTYSMIWEM